MEDLRERPEIQALENSHVLRCKQSKKNLEAEEWSEQNQGLITKANIIPKAFPQLLHQFFSAV